MCKLKVVTEKVNVVLGTINMLFNIMFVGFCGLLSVCLIILALQCIADKNTKSKSHIEYAKQGKIIYSPSKQTKA